VLIARTDFVVHSELVFNLYFYLLLRTNGVSQEFPIFLNIFALFKNNSCFFMYYSIWIFMFALCQIKQKNT